MVLHTYVCAVQRISVTAYTRIHVSIGSRVVSCKEEGRGDGSTNSLFLVSSPVTRWCEQRAAYAARRQ